MRKSYQYRRRIPKRRYYHRGKRCSKGEKIVAKFLDNNGILYEMEKTFEECVSLKGKPLRFDFFLPEHNTCIEFDGQHHYKPVNKYRSAQITHAKTIIHDRIKNTFCAENNYYLIRIPHWDIDNFQDQLLESLNQILPISNMGVINELVV